MGEDLICFHVPSTGPGSEELLRKNWFSVKMSDPRSMEFYVNRIPLSSPSVLRRTLVNPLEMLSGGRASCVDAGPAGPPPLPNGRPSPISVAGADLWQERRVWTSAVGMEEGSVRLVGLRYRGNLVSGL